MQQADGKLLARVAAHFAESVKLKQQAAEVWDELRVGDALTMEREPENPHDANAVSVSWRGRKLGYVPRRDNAALAWGLDRGEPLRARISRLTSHPNPSKRVEFEVYAQ